MAKRKHRRILIGVGILAAVLIAARMALPYILTNVINKKLANLPQYKGHISGMHLALWRGAYWLKDFQLVHEGKDIQVEIPVVKISLLWPALFHGSIVGNITLDQPLITLVVNVPSEAVGKVKGKTNEVKGVENTQGKTTPQVLNSIIVFRVDRLEINDGTIKLRETTAHAEDKNKSEKEDAPFLTDIYVLVTNLTNSKKVSESLVSHGHASAKITGDGSIKLDLNIDPTAEKPRFDIRVQIEKFDLASLNQFLQWQLGLVFKQGKFAMDAEASAADGAFKGYVKPFVENLKVEAPADKKTFLKRVEKVVINVSAVVFKNNKSDKVAARIPFAGRVDDPNADIWRSILSLLRNAFIEAIKPGLDPSIKIASA